MEDNYYKKFIAPLISEFDVYAKGFEIVTHKPILKPKLLISEINSTKNTTLFGDQAAVINSSNDKLMIDLSFCYDDFIFNANSLEKVSVSVEKKDEKLLFPSYISKP